MNGIRNVTSTSWLHNYKTEKVVNQQEFVEVENRKLDDEERFLGATSITSLNGISSYSMIAEYAEDYSKDNPIIKIYLGTENGTVEEHYININEINPRNATEMEMFALCNYADANGMGTGDGRKSFEKLFYYRINALDNGYFDLSNGTDNFVKSKQDWVSVVTNMRGDYMGAGIYRQALDGSKLLQLFEKWNGENNIRGEVSYWWEDRGVYGLGDKGK